MPKPQSHILVVDDDLVLLEVLTYVLEDLGYRVSVATDGAAGLALAQDGSVALVLLDVSMPKMTGTEVGRHLRKDPKTAEIRIVMHTALEESEVRREFADYDEFAPKTDDVEGLTETIAASLRGFQGQPPPERQNQP